MQPLAQVTNSSIMITAGTERQKTTSASSVSPSTIRRTPRSELHDATSRSSFAKRARIAFLDHTAVLGGGEIALLHLVQALDSTRFHVVVVLSSDGPLVEKLRAAGIETHVLPLAASVVEARKDNLDRHALTRGRDAARLVAYCFRVARFLRRRRVDVLHTNSLKADLIGGVAGRLARVPVLWHVRDRIEDDYLPPKVVRAFRLLCRVLPRAVIANSAATLSTLHLPATFNATAVHDGIPLEEESADGNVEYSGGAPVVGLVGRISAWKGQHIFIEAAALVQKEFPDARFQIIGSALFGEENYEREVREQALATDLGENLEWLGFREGVPELMRALDILVHASTVGEPFGQVVIEGMAQSKPVVATRGGGVPEIVEDGVTGVLVPMGDAAAMAHAVIELLHAPARAREMGEAGKRRVHDFFSIERTARQVENVYASLLARR